MKLKEETFRGRIVRSKTITIGKNKYGEPIKGGKLWIQTSTNIPGLEQNIIVTCVGDDVNFVGCDGMMVEGEYYNRVAEPRNDFFNDPRVIRIRQI